MIRLLHIEFKKILSYKTFWVLTAFYIIALALALFLSQHIITKIVEQAAKTSPIPLPRISIFVLPKAWQNLSYLAGYFNIFLAIVVITLICNEFTFRTIRQNIVSGLSRVQYLLSKLYLILVISVAATLLLFLITLILGVIHTHSLSAASVFNVKLQFMFGYFLETFSYLIFAFFLAFLLKRTGLTIITLLFYTSIEQIIVAWKVPSAWVKVMPMKAFARLVHFPSIPLPEVNGQSLKFQDFVGLPDALISVLYAAVMVTIIYLYLRKADL
jgi:ABC-2 type transport system permease protein